MQALNKAERAGSNRYIDFIWKPVLVFELTYQFQSQLDSKRRKSYPI